MSANSLVALSTTGIKNNCDSLLFFTVTLFVLQGGPRLLYRFFVIVIARESGGTRFMQVSLHIQSFIVVAQAPLAFVKRWTQHVDTLVVMVKTRDGQCLSVLFV